MFKIIYALGKWALVNENDNSILYEGTFDECEQFAVDNKIEVDLSEYQQVSRF